MTLKPTISQKIKQKVLNRDRNKCQKCGFLGTSEDLKIHYIKPKQDNGNNHPDNLVTLCPICYYYAPDKENEFKQYLNEKIDGNILNTFRKAQKTIAKQTKHGMIKKFNKGQLVTRAPLGYKIENKQLIPSENSYIIQEIYQDFLNTEKSLTKLSKKYNLSVNGLKKVLTNYTYLGKIKFDGQVRDGKHQPLLSSTLFNRVQDKLKEKGFI